MLLPKFDYHEPMTLNEACEMMAEFREKARPIAGGTDLIVNMKKGVVSPENVVSLGRIPELNRVNWSEGLTGIGACTKVSQLTRSEEICSKFFALAQAARCLGSPLIRNLATIGGNLVSARPAADLPPPLLAYDGTVILKSASRERKISLQHFFLGPGKTVMEPEEILTEIFIERPPPRSGAAYWKLGFRRALEISIVSVASFISLESRGQRIESARIVLGAVAPTPVRAISAERLLIGEKPTDSLFVRAGEVAAGESKPITDIRGSAGYRQAMVAVLAERTLRIASEKASGQAGRGPLTNPL
jgi:CO/xanthine dehydrogenase FAD-binding subunit